MNFFCCKGSCPVMSYAPFNVKLSILPQLLKLEEHFNQYEKLGGKLAGDMKAAVLLKVIGGPLKTHLNLTLNEGSSYQKIREKEQFITKALTGEEKRKHSLTHVPFGGWCSSCVKHRAKQDQHRRTGHARE